MERRESDSHGLFSSGDTSDNDYEMGAGFGGAEGPGCECDVAPCSLHSETHSPHSGNSTQEMLLCEHCGKNRKMVTRFSEGYGTEEECGLSDPQGDSDADADIEDTDSRLHEAGSLHRISSRRRKRPRISRQDTTESEDDGGHSHRTHRWNLRLSPSHSRPIMEESISQVRPLVVCPLSNRDSAVTPGPSKRPLPRSLLFLLILPLSLSAVIIIMTYFTPWTSAR